MMSNILKRPGWANVVTEARGSGDPLRNRINAYINANYDPQSLGGTLFYVVTNVINWLQTDLKERMQEEQGKPISYDEMIMNRDKGISDEDIKRAIGGVISLSRPRTKQELAAGKIDHAPQPPKPEDATLGTENAEEYTAEDVIRILGKYNVRCSPYDYNRYCYTIKGQTGSIDIELDNDYGPEIKIADIADHDSYLIVVKSKGNAVLNTVVNSADGDDGDDDVTDDDIKDKFGGYTVKKVREDVSFVYKGTAATGNLITLRTTENFGDNISVSQITPQSLITATVFRQKEGGGKEAVINALFKAAPETDEDKIDENGDLVTEPVVVQPATASSAAPSGQSTAKTNYVAPIDWSKYEEDSEEEADDADKDGKKKKFVGRDYDLAKEDSREHVPEQCDENIKYSPTRINQLLREDRINKARHQYTIQEKWKFHY